MPLLTGHPDTGPRGGPQALLPSCFSAVGSFSCLGGGGSPALRPGHQIHTVHGDTPAGPPHSGAEDSAVFLGQSLSRLGLGNKLLALSFLLFFVLELEITLTVIVFFIPLCMISPMPPTKDVRLPALFLVPPVSLSPPRGSLLQSRESGLTVRTTSVRMGVPGSGKAVNGDGASDLWRVARQLAWDAVGAGSEGQSFGGRLRGLPAEHCPPRW